MKPTLEPVLKPQNEWGLVKSLVSRLALTLLPKQRSELEDTKKLNKDKQLKAEPKPAPSPALDKVADAMVGFGSTLLALISLDAGPAPAPEMNPEPAPLPKPKQTPTNSPKPSPKPGLSPREKVEQELKTPTLRVVPRFDPQKPGHNPSKLFRPPQPGASQAFNQKKALELAAHNKMLEELKKRSSKPTPLSIVPRMSP